MKECPECQGSGKPKVPSSAHEALYSCAYCDGTGKVEEVKGGEEGCIDRRIKK